MQPDKKYYMPKLSISAYAKECGKVPQTIRKRIKEGKIVPDYIEVKQMVIDTDKFPPDKNK